MLFNIIECLGDLGFGNRGSVITNAYRQCRPFHKMVDNHENGEFREIRLKDFVNKNPDISVIDNRTFVVFSNKSRKVGKQWKNSIMFRIKGPEFICESSSVEHIILDMQSKSALEYRSLAELCSEYGFDGYIRHSANCRVGILDYFVEPISKAKTKKLDTEFSHPVIVKPFYQFKVNY